MRRRVYPTRIEQVPADAVWVTEEGVAAIVATYTSANGKPSARGWGRATNKPDFAHFYRDIPHRDAMVKAFFDKVKERDAAKAKVRADRKAEIEAGLNIAVGDVFYEGGRYYNFYEVVGLIGKQSVSLRAIAKNSIPKPGGDYGMVTPIKGDFTGEPITKRLGRWDIIKIRDGLAAYKWDGLPKEEIYND
jgi:hypothetical protein